MKKLLICFLLVMFRNVHLFGQIPIEISDENLQCRAIFHVGNDSIKSVDLTFINKGDSNIYLLSYSEYYFRFQSLTGDWFELGYSVNYICNGAPLLMSQEFEVANLKARDSLSINLLVPQKVNAQFKLRMTIDYLINKEQGITSIKGSKYIQKSRLINLQVPISL